MSRCLSSLIVLVILGAMVAPTRAADKDDQRRIFTEGTNQTPAWMVRVDVDNSDRVYHVGEQMVVRVISEQDGYLYLFNVDPNGEIECLFPNNVHSDNAIKGGQKLFVGAEKFRLRVGQPAGRELLKAVVTREPLKGVKVEELIDPRQPVPRQLSPRVSRMLMVEAITGDAKLGDSDESVGKIRDNFQRDNPEKFKQQAQAYAEHQIEIVTVGSKDEFRPQEKRVGLFIGISEFKDQTIRQLWSAHKDAGEMESAMKERGKFTKTYLLTNKEATLSNIRRHVEKLVQETRPGDTVLIYWSGHGGYNRSADELFLVPHDGELTSQDTVHRTMLLDKTFARWVQELDGRRVMVILDTCHSGGHADVAKGLKKDDKDLVKGISKDSTIQAHFLETEIARAKSIGQKDASVLASSTAKQVSFERRERDYSVMTYFIVKLMQKENAGALTLEEVHKRIKEDVKKYVEDTFDGTTQTPVFSGQLISPAPLLRP